MVSVYTLMHVHRRPSGHEDQKMIGVYSSAANARKRLPELRRQPGFRDFPEDFHVVRHEVDRDNPREGFAFVPTSHQRSNLAADAGASTQPQGAPSVVYMLWHEYEALDGDTVTDVERLVGFYSSEGKAKDAVARLKGHPAFRDHPNHFQIEGYIPDKSESWLEGFAVWDPVNARWADDRV